jgi:hypothetical protein
MILTIATKERQIEVFDGTLRYDMKYRAGSPMDTAIKLVEQLAKININSGASLYGVVAEEIIP